MHTSEPERRAAGADMTGRTCPYCRFPLKEGGEIAVCPECHAAHHGDCWTDNGGCAIVGCAAGPAPSAKRAADVPPRVESELPPVGKPTQPLRADLPPTPASTPSLTGGGRPRGLSLSIAIIMLAVAGGGVAAALIVTSQKNGTTTISQVTAPAPRPPTSTGSPPSTTSSSTSSTSTTGTRSSTSTSTSSTTPTTTAPAGAGAIAALRQYWTLVAQGNYDAAYAMDTPGYAATQGGSWVANETTAAPAVNIVSVGPATVTGDTANVSLNIWTKDANLSGPGSDTDCHNFDSAARMVRGSDGSWQYDGFVPGTTNGGSLDGNPNCPG